MNFLSRFLSKFRQSLSNTNIDFMAFHKIALILSIVGIIGSLALVLIKGLNFGIDFAGGILIEARIEDKVNIAEMRSFLSHEIHDVQIQNIDTNDYLIRVAKTSEDQTIIIKKIQDLLQSKYNKIEYRKVDYVGPQVGRELILKGFLALSLSFLFIMIYIWIRFDWQFGICGIFALLHDSALTLGFLSIKQ